MMSWIELTATVFGFLCVLFTIRRSVWCWPRIVTSDTNFAFCVTLISPTTTLGIAAARCIAMIFNNESKRI